MAPATKAIRKYLEQHAEPECQLLDSLPEELHFEHCVIIPCYDEQADFFERLTSAGGLLESNRALAIVIINRPDRVAASPINQALMAIIKQQLSQIWCNGELSLLGHQNWGILLVDRDSHSPIPHKKGVGLARKIGADLAASLIASGHIDSHWIHSTDADAHLPEDYFAASRQRREVAAIYRYRHLDDGTDTGSATQTYQSHLNYYVAGLRWAGSPYAFHTLGSILAFNYNQYCQARGFPKRAGGEDFYLLNKIAKLGPIAQLNSELLLEPRLSHRVPFGTGPAVEKILDGQSREQNYLDYDPRTFALLKHWLNVMEHWLLSDSKEPPELPLPIQEALTQLGVDELWQHLQNKRGSQRQHHFHLWFDGFRTLKFIHELQHNDYPAIPLRESPERCFTDELYRSTLNALD